jgi:hypothetical protein
MMLVVAQEQPSIESSSDGIIISVAEGAKVWVREGTTLNELVPTSVLQSYIAALEAKMTARMDDFFATVNEGAHSHSCRRPL